MANARARARWPKTPSTSTGRRRWSGDGGTRDRRRSCGRSPAPRAGPSAVTAQRLVQAAVEFARHATPPPLLERPRTSRSPSSPTSTRPSSASALPTTPRESLSPATTHVLDVTRTRGGHVLDLVFDHGELAVSTGSELHLHLPTTSLRAAPRPTRRPGTPTSGAPKVTRALRDHCRRHRSRSCGGGSPDRSGRSRGRVARLVVG